MGQNESLPSHSHDIFTGEKHAEGEWGYNLGYAPFVTGGYQGTTGKWVSGKISNIQNTAYKDGAKVTTLNFTSKLWLRKF